MRIGIFFGGPSREREISFAGGRTVYDNLDKSIFTPVPIFLDAQRRMILLDWKYIYKGSIRDFYPPAAFLPPSSHQFQIYSESLEEASPEEQDRMLREVGRPLSLDELPELMDMAFLALHGEYGEDGQIQGLLESLCIPYTGSGIRASAIGMDKAFQKRWMQAAGFACPPMMVMGREEWRMGELKNGKIEEREKLVRLPADVRINDWYEEAASRCGFPLVIRPANQGSSIGVSIIGESEGREGFERALEKAFFCRRLNAAEWKGLSEGQKVEWVRKMNDIRDGLGLPLRAHGPRKEEGKRILHPESLLTFLQEKLCGGVWEEVWLEADQAEQQVVVEGFLRGKEFSCIVLRTEAGEGLALPPTEIVKGGEVFDYRSKYLPGLSRKETPIKLPAEQVQAIRRECERLFDFFGFNTYARIDGFISPEGDIFLNDPNTTSGMLPSSFFFHQAAEIGLTPSQFLTYILRTSLWERMKHSLVHNHFPALLQRLDQRIDRAQAAAGQRLRVAIILGGYSYERHISVESGRNVFEKLASSEKYEPVPVFLTGDAQDHHLYRLPINLLLKDNADDIRDNILQFERNRLLEQIRDEATTLTQKYAAADVIFEPRALTYDELAADFDAVFLALHGRPGEDGTVQRELEVRGLPYNGSEPSSAAVTIHKYETLRRLAAAGFTVTGQELLPAEDFRSDPGAFLDHVEQRFRYPFIAKPVDDGCSSAVMLIRSRQQLEHYLQALFRESEALNPELRRALALGYKEEFPQKTEVLLEDLITAQDADRFLEITGGFLTHYREGELVYEMFEPSEALAGGEVLSLEEKFLAGEGQNLTPARFTTDPEKHESISAQVREVLQRAAQLLGVEGYARIDAFVRVYEQEQRAETIIVEVNSLPGMTPATAIFHQAALNGYKPYEFIDHILEFGREREKRRTAFVG